MTDIDNAATLIRDLAEQARTAKMLQPGSVYAHMSAAGPQLIDLTADQYLDFPRRKRGTVTVRNVASFAQYFKKHADEDSEVYADLDAATVTAVLDAHRSAGAAEDRDMEEARWQQHRLVLVLQETLPWQEWTGRDRKMMPQQMFAEFIEDHARDVDPEGRVKAADLLEIAQNFQAHTTVRFTSAKRLASGQAQFEYTEDTTASSRTGKGTIEIPTEFDLAIWPYEDCKPASHDDLKVVAARFRYRIEGGDLKLGYFLNDPARHAREAVASIVAKLEEQCDLQVMHGQPA